MAESNLHPDQDIQKRRSTRIVQAVPLTVAGVDALGRPFQERTSTLIISCHGCRYQSKHYVLKNMWVTLEVPHNETGHAPRRVRGRVTWIQRPRTVRELFQIGLELEVSGNVWGIAFPPADWFPFPETETNLEIPASPEAPVQPAPEAQAWVAEEGPAVRVHEPAEDNVRVFPSPAGPENQVQLARQFARLVSEAKQQIQDAVRDSAAQSVAAETKPLLAALQSQLQDAAEKSVSAAVAAQFEHVQQETLRLLEQGQETSLSAVREKMARELDQVLSEARQKIDTQLAELGRARQSDFDQQIQSHLQIAVQRMENLTGLLKSNEMDVRAAMEQLRQSSGLAAADQMRLWQEEMNQRAADAQARLSQMEQAAKRLEEQISTATAIGGSRWRGILEADLAAANARWNEKAESLIEEASRQAARRLAENSEVAARQIEQELQSRIGALANAHSEAAVDAESALTTLREAISQETAKGAAVLSQTQESVAQLETKRGEFSALMEGTSEEWTKRSGAILDAQSSELRRQAESTVAGMAERIRPILEEAQRAAIHTLAGELEQRVTPHTARAEELISKLAFDRDQAERALAEHQQRVWQASERNLQDTAARGKEILAQIEKDFGESARESIARWLTELETRATETSHSTFEALFKSADWYEKKVQTQMQTTLEKGLEQATSRLRERAGEMSSLYASELDHYSRSYIEHSQGAMRENAREAAERASLEIAEAGHLAGAKFSARAAQLGQEQFELFTSKAKAALEQTTANMEASTVQVRGKLESDARAFAVEFQRALGQHAQRTLAQGKQELSAQIDQSKDNLAIESQTLERQFRGSLQSVGTFAMDEHKQRLENASNSWLLTTVAKLNQQSQSFIDQMAEATKVRLKAVCNGVFAEMGEILRQRFAGLTAPPAPPAAPTSPAPPADAPEAQE